MRRLIHHCLGWGAALLLAAGGLLAPAPEPTPTRAAEPAPTAPGTAHKAYAEKIPDSDVTFDMVPIPGGTYLMGSPPAEKGRGADEGPQHPVTVKPFWMGKCEVRWDEFDVYWRKRPGGKEDKDPESPPNADAITRPTPPYEDETFAKLGGGGREGFPVLCISHHTAMQYCRWLSMKTGKAYRLPTEAEWEWAARAGTTTAYFWGDDPKQMDDYAWSAGNSEELAHPVGKKKPNPWGLYD
ncbi:MAG TPA: SUMF1/EgtB/PvdO family nonheme iron enzyme, partial [Gemmataceae bacterium]|nr:SUMF1/EgtB/PvdO family nonheme iron enzyme [Gemmataceae bacterium]